MKTIWKYTLTPNCTLSIPKNAVILDIQEQDNQPRMWCLVDPKEEKIQRKFASYETGHAVPDKPGLYRGTFQIKKEGLVFHVFEVT